jgi:hypothetical protein
MCSSCCALGVVGKCREHQFLFVTGVVSITFELLDGEERIILK